MQLFFLACFLALKTTVLEIGGAPLSVEIADTDDSRMEGLKGRRHLPEGKGMLFVFEEPRPLYFWMQDTLIPLSVGFFDAEQILINTADMLPPKKGGERLLQYKSKSPAKYALEVPIYWFRDHQVFPGMKFSFQDPSISVKIAKHE